MALYFISEEHEILFNRLKDSLNGKTEQTCLYLLTSVSGVRKVIDDVWRGFLDIDLLENLPLSSGERVVVAVAMNLYNGYEMEGVSLSPIYLFSLVDKDFQKVLLTAIEHRYALAG